MTTISQKIAEIIKRSSTMLAPPLKTRSERQAKREEAVALLREAILPLAHSGQHEAALAVLELASRVEVAKDTE